VLSWPFSKMFRKFLAVLAALCLLASLSCGLQLKMVSTTSRPASTIFERLSTAARFVVERPVRVQYSTAMAARVAFFLSQGLIITRLPGLASEPASSPSPAPKMAPLDFAAVIGAVSDALLTDSPDEIGFQIPGVSEKAFLESDEQRALFGKNFAAIIKLLRTDLENVENGSYKLPYDLTPSMSSPQWNPLSVLTTVSNYVSDRREVLARSRRRGGQEVRDRMVFSERGRYPEYYLQNFHYQTDGWLSQESARIYDYQVEALFLGTADAMRRQLLPQMTRFFRETKSSSSGAGVKHLDVATGTGRFMSFVMDNFPQLDAVALDLSPFYLREAQQLLAAHETVKFVESAAEEMPFPDASFDSISCVYMFHELPREVRSKVVAEMARVLKPGGKVFFCDSAQKGEVPVDRVLEGFTIIAHEPYYMDYTEQNLKELFANSGLLLDEGSEQVHWVSKVLSFTKA